MMEALISSETSVPTRATRRNISEDAILQYNFALINYMWSLIKFYLMLLLIIIILDVISFVSDVDYRLRITYIYANVLGVHILR
jgi:hypothetical protein